MSAFNTINNPTITGFTQTAPILVSGIVRVPPGTKRIEALLCGGGGGSGSSKGGAGFGGIQIYEIPVISSTLTLIVGAGGASGDNRGGSTSVSIYNFIYAVVGGGGCGTSNSVIQNANGIFGGSGGGSSATSSYKSGAGGPPFNTKNLLWSGLDFATKSGYPAGYSVDLFNSSVININSLGANSSPNNRPTDANFGWGGGGGGGNNSASGGGGGPQITAGAGGGGSSHADFYVNGRDGGSMTSVSIWGLTGFAGGTGVSDNNVDKYGYGGGGGGMLGAGANAVYEVSGGNGGLGGGGAGGHAAGGNGFGMFRFYY